MNSVSGSVRQSRGVSLERASEVLNQINQLSIINYPLSIDNIAIIGITRYVHIPFEQTGKTLSEALHATSGTGWDLAGISIPDLISQRSRSVLEQE
ncbi:MAG: hypothetical protein F6K31_12410 [Symploca sp. SIO2G7]|nr:hypothetical protein [Symploca sp. SIO2G7]